MKKVKKGDKVIVNKGKSKKDIGEVLSVDGDLVLVKGVNIGKKRVKSNDTEKKKNELVEIERPINISNVSFYDEVKKKGTRIYFKGLGKEKVRLTRSSNKEIKNKK